ncbi:MgtC/SapB family protein [Liquorilactobacillus oeni]|uniref:MgtC family magnesium (Mg2+) transporter-C n=1 Tax=Liquorilactobacillus oeni DSM 19972 TaxID=1423777 RepID=A0A0R1M8N0_9LACO|nr:MgtC/SapB family protein [Liquorilactobacillus oeni]KRL04460.1 MgtC family magnesium (Mg2+) transporter-C [Liquorilactobacillus oeni DSM 19972]
MQWLFGDNQIEWCLRLVLATICGGIIGYERRSKMKAAGVRTHILVTMGSALIMIVSKYAFFDIAQKNGMSLDPSRISAQVVSGIGFIGAGAILTKHKIIDGLTTATGLWVAAGIGLALGSGMYTIAIAATACVLLTQVVISRIDSHKIRGKTGINIFISYRGKMTEIEDLQERLKKREYPDVNFNTLYYEEDHFKLRLHIAIYSRQELNRLFDYLAQDPKMIYMEVE